jgi:hypothetical protein
MLHHENSNCINALMWILQSEVMELAAAFMKTEGIMSHLWTETCIQIVWNITVFFNFFEITHTENQSLVRVNLIWTTVHYIYYIFSCLMESILIVQHVFGCGYIIFITRFHFLRNTDLKENSTYFIITVNLLSEELWWHILCYVSTPSGTFFRSVIWLPLFLCQNHC